MKMVKYGKFSRSYLIHFTKSISYREHWSESRSWSRKSISSANGNVKSLVYFPNSIWITSSASWSKR